MDRFESILTAIGYLRIPLRLLLLVVQAVAIYGALAYYADLHWALSAFVPAVFLYFCRIQSVNCALAVLGAFYGWGMSWVGAISVIFGLLALLLIVKAFGDVTQEMAT